MSEKKRPKRGKVSLVVPEPFEEDTAELESLRRELAQWHDLAAILCGDGGHYLADHGTAETISHCKDAFFKKDERIAALIAEAFALQDICAGESIRANALQADRDRLQAIVDKLPKTADGVVVVPFVDTVWIWHIDMVEEMRISAMEDNRGWRCTACTWNMYFDKAVSECYSTREAAEAAKGTK